MRPELGELQALESERCAHKRIVKNKQENRSSRLRVETGQQEGPTPGSVAALGLLEDDDDIFLMEREPCVIVFRVQRMKNITCAIQTGGSKQKSWLVRTQSDVSLGRILVAQSLGRR